MTVEVTLFKLAAGVEIDAFRQAAREASLHLQQFDGFLSRKLFYDPESDRWADILHWYSREHALRAAEQVLRMEAFEPFIQKIDPSTVQMYHGEPVDVAV